MTLRTIPDLIGYAARRYGDRPALAIRRGLRTERWSYRQVAVGATRAARRLRGVGIRPGDRVLILAANSPELVVALLGAWEVGAILVPLDLRTPADVIVRIAEQTEPRLLIADAAPDPADSLADLLRLSPLELAAEEERGRPQRTLPGSGAGQPPRDTDAPPGLAEVVFTSGTTGDPKGVMLTHANILANVRAAREFLPITPGTRLLSLLPLSHMMEQTAGLLTALASGATVYYATSRRSSAILAAFQRHQIGLIVCVPEVLALLLAGIEREVDRSGRRRTWDRLHAVAARLPMVLRPALFRAVHGRLGGHFRMALCGGAPLDAEVWAAWEQLGVTVVQGYGATECAPIVTSNRHDRRLPGVGWPLRDVELRLAPDGEIMVRGPNVTAGYWRSPTLTAASFESGWYRTGDLGTRGPSGTLLLHGRKKDTIVLSDGRNVFPEDVEASLRVDPSIKACVVVGRPRGAGVEVHAVVVPSGDPAEAEAAIRRANARLGPHQHISGWTIWPEPDLPRTPSLKVKRGEVLAALAGERAAAPAVTVTPLGGSLEERACALIARATRRPLDRVRPAADLTLDLGLDSLGRIELAVLLEEELGRSPADEEIASLRTVGDLLAALERGGSRTPPEPLPGWPRGWLVRNVRSLAQDVLLRPLLWGLGRPFAVSGQAHLAGLRGPVLLIANHSSHLDSATVLAALPPTRRQRTAVAAAADYFFTSRPLTLFSTIVLGAFPFHREGPVAASLAHCGDLVDDGWSVLVFPEGTRSRDGSLGAFKPGIGLLARQLGAPVVPIGLIGLHAVLPKGRSLPRPGPIRAVVGEPISVPDGLSIEAASQFLEDVLRRLIANAGNPPAPAARV
ncbi:MAG: AMP-binding protein [Chloroflexi bacterium]|nr:AMP-binding protein [Chloroflexota bacterium]